MGRGMRYTGAALGALALLTAACGGGSTKAGSSATSSTGSPAAGAIAPGNTSTSSASGASPSTTAEPGGTPTSGAQATGSTTTSGRTPTTAVRSTSTTGNPTTTTAKATTTTARPTTTTSGTTTNVTATETEYKITLSQSTFHPGTYVFKVVNAGTVTHALDINGPGVSNRGTSDLNPGESATLTVTLQAGSYDIYCPIDSHKALGMDLHITVS